jgi:salicylate hydroxylase
MRVAVVGAGLGGLAVALGLRRAGHAVAIYEQAPELGEVGAGIQVAPNASRILRDWGLGEALDAVAVRALTSRRRRWEDGRLLAETQLGKAVLERYGAPYAHVHRADLHAMLHRACLADDDAGEPVELHLASTVADVRDADGSAARLVLADGEEVTADLVIGADGIHSRVRRSLGVTEDARFSGDTAWRAVISVRDLQSAGDFGWLLEEPSMTVWLGPGQHVVHYLVRNQELLNLVALVPGSESTESWLKEGDPQDLRDAFVGWAPQLTSILDCVQSATTSALYDRRPLSTWVSGRVALLGDACHAMLPYQAQGAAQAFEDAAVLVAELDGASVEEVPARLQAYEEARHPRATRVQEASRANREWFHMPDGPEQQERDRSLAEFSGDAMVSFDWLWSGRRDIEEVGA